MAVYAIHYSKPAGDTTRPRMYAQVYVGYADDNNVNRRLQSHFSGTSGASLPIWFAQQGIAPREVVILTGLDRRDERRIKKGGHFYQRLFVPHVWDLPKWIIRRLYQTSGSHEAYVTDPDVLAVDPNSDDSLPF